MLAVIDMQKKFPASYQIVDSVVKEIEKAKKKREVIALVHYDKGPSIKPIQQAVKGYDRLLTVTKYKDDGGLALFDVLTRVYDNLGHKYISARSIKSIKVCGVNTSACIIRTVRSLAFLRIPIKVLSHACANKYPDRDDAYNIRFHNGALKRMNSWKNVTVI